MVKLTKKYLLFLVALLLFAVGCERAEQEEVISVPACYDPLFQKDETCDFRGIRWGMSPEEVKAAESMEVFEEKPYTKPREYLVCYQNIPFDSFENVTLRYFFLDEKCFLGMYYFSENDLPTYVFLLEKMAKIYGPPSYAKDTDRLTKGWQTEDTFIFLTLDYDDEEPLIAISIGSKDHRPKEWDLTYEP